MKKFNRRNIFTSLLIVIVFILISTYILTINYFAREMAVRGDLKKVKLFLSLGAMLSTTDEYDLSLLHLASKSGNIKLVKLLESHGLDIYEEGGYERITMLHCAAESGNLDLIKYLVEEKKLDIEQEKWCRGCIDKKAVHIAACNANYLSLRYLINYTDMKNKKEDQFQMILKNSIVCGMFDNFKKLVHDFNYEKNFIETSENFIGCKKDASGNVQGCCIKLISAITNDTQIDFLKFIVNSLSENYPSKVIKDNVQACGLIIYNNLVETDSLETIKYMIEYIVDEEFMSEHIDSLFTSSFVDQNERILEYSMKNGAKINEISYKNETSLDQALTLGHNNLVKILRKYNAKTYNELKKKK